jgi:hypothetical protein
LGSKEHPKDKSTQVARGDSCQRLISILTSGQILATPMPWTNRPAVDDYSHERVWRVPQKFDFKLSDIEFVIVPNYEAVAKFPNGLNNSISRNKFIIVEVYSQIGKLLPGYLM